MTLRRAGCSGMGTSGSEGGQQKPTSRKTGRALLSDPYTKLRGPTKGIWFHLYVLIDIYSRYNPGWIVAAREDSALAKDFLDEAITRNGTVPHTVHADSEYGGCRYSRAS